MPIYEYKCKACDEHFDVEQSFHDDPLTTIPGCDTDPSGQHPVRKVFSAVGISFKGDGFYRNDSRSSASASSKNGSSGSDGNGSSSSDSSSSGSSSESSTSSSSSSSSESKSSSGGSSTPGSSGDKASAST